jgi:NTE family protein
MFVRFHVLRRLIVVAGSIGVLLAVAACSTAHYPINAALQAVDPAAGYRMRQIVRNPGDEELFVVLTFSGGGTRAAALAYGVLEELARAQIEWRGQRKRLLDEVDMLYGVSGGSITAAYWAMNGDRIFSEFEQRFLARDLQSQLFDTITSLSNLWRLNSSRFGRGELLESRLDEALFHGATFADLAARQQGPFVIISAADLSTGARFDFTQDYFDLLCSDLARFPVARAVAASSSVPLVFSPITLWNHAGRCGYAPSKLVAAAVDAPAPRHLGESRMQLRAREMAAYLDADRNPYVHLVDGGVADNLAVRGLLEIADIAQNQKSASSGGAPLRLRKFLFITVDAGTDSSSQISKSADIPGFGAVVEAIADIPIQRYSTETRLLLQAAFERWRVQTSEAGAAGDAPELYTIEVSLRSVPGEQERRQMMQLPTTLYLPASDVRSLREAAGQLVRNAPDFQRLMRAVGVKATGVSPDVKLLP